MRWPSRENERQRLFNELTTARSTFGFRGIPDVATVDTLAWQFIASLRREDYYRLIRSKPIAAHRANPNSLTFDVERAVAFHTQQGNIDEAGWLIFLMTHFARHKKSGWQRLQDVYGKLGAGIWDWVSVRANPPNFFQWLSTNWQNIGGAFGNHRKYESLNPDANRPMSRTVEEYIAWVGANGHQNLFVNAVQTSGNDPHVIFDYLYQSLNVSSFGRLAKFDYLSLIGRYNLAPIAAGSAYLDGSTGPAKGAKLLVDGSTPHQTTNASLQIALNKLDSRLNVGMTVMEDALCNWQKSPIIFIHYTG